MVPPVHNRRARLKKRWGQHHLVQPHLCRPLIEFLAPAGHRVIEVGAGGGVLTRLLLEAGARVTALEVDPEWAFRLPAELGVGRWSLAVADALELSFERLPPGTLVAGNLPYNIATTLVVELAQRGYAVPRAAFLVQREVADRLAAPPGRRAYGAVTVLLACHARVERLGHIRPGAFRPSPKVDSTMIGLVRHRPPLAENRLPAFRRLVRLGFGQKRKTLANALRASIPRATVEAALRSLDLDVRLRAEALSLAQWVALYDQLGDELPDAG